MGLLSIIKKQKLKDREIRVLILGLDNSGKTTIVKNFLGEDVSQISPTMGFQISSVVYNGFNLNVWDVGGQRTLRPFWSNYLERTDSIVWVVDGSSIERFGESFEEFSNILMEDRLVGCNVLIFVNKTDLLARDAVAGVVAGVTQRLGLERVRNHNWNVVGCSGITGEGIKRGFDWVVSEVEERLYVGSAALGNDQRSRVGDSVAEGSVASS